MKTSSTPTSWQTNMRSWTNSGFVGVLMLSSARPPQSKTQVLWESLWLPAGMFYLYFNGSVPASCQLLRWQTPSQTGLSETAGRLRSSHMCSSREEVMPLCAQSSQTCLSSSGLLKASSTTWKDSFSVSAAFVSHMFWFMATTNLMLFAKTQI